MKKVMFIMAAALLMMTQCKKENETPTDPAEGTVKMTVTAGPGRTDISTETGSITWSAGDKLYVSDGTNWLGSLTLVGEGGSAQGTFTGSIAGIGDGTTSCHFFYLGHDNGMTEPTGSTAASIPFAAQDGTLAGAMKYHTGYGSTDVTVTEGEATGSVVMNTKIAIAHINFTIYGTTAYKGSVTMGGTGISNTLTVSPDGTFSGSGDGGIVIGGTTGERYVTLIPTAETDRVDVTFTGDATGSMTFLAGISENKFYGMKDAMTVTMKFIKFTVDDSGTAVRFAPGNLYWDGSAFRFEANQWSFASTWDANHVSHFFWSKSASVAYASNYSDSGASTDDEFFTNSSSFQVHGEDAGTWRTLSDSEWEYLLYTRTNAVNLRAWKELDDGTHKGLVILPDGPASVMSSIRSTADLETYGAVFLPAAGKRNGTDVDDAGSYGNYWSGTLGEDCAFSLYFVSNRVYVNPYDRELGNSVRLVR